MRSRFPQLAACLFICFGSNVLAQTGIPKRSDVMFPKVAEVQELRSFHADQTAWGFMKSIRGDFDTAEWEKSVEDHHKQGLKIHGRIEWDLNWDGIRKRHPADYEKAACRDFEGNPVYFPWNDKQFWFCNHQPIFQEYLRFQIREMALSAKPDGLLFDSQTGTPTSYKRGGCFCDQCMLDFPKWLSEHFTAEELAKWGIDDIFTWNYHHYLKASGWNLEQYKSHVLHGKPVPLGSEYKLFQKEYLNQLVSDLISYAQDLAGYKLAISCSSPVHDLYYAGVRMVQLPEIDFYTQEYNHRIDTLRVPEHTILLYKLAEAMEKPLVLTAQPEPDWWGMFHNDRLNLSWSWIAQAYANGANFIVPRRMWGYQGTVHVYFEGKQKGYEKIYRLMIIHPELFDDYEAVSHVGLLYVHRAHRHRDKTVDRLAAELMMRNIPFRLEIAGDSWWPKYLDKRRLQSLDAIVVHRDLLKFLDSKQRAVLGTVKRKCVEWNGDDLSALDKQMSREISVSAHNVASFPRQKTGDAKAPYILHLVNHNYVAEKEVFEKQKDFEVVLSEQLFGGVGSKALYHTPQSEEPIALEILSDKVGQSYRFRVPSLNHWGIVQIMHDASEGN